MDITDLASRLYPLIVSQMQSDGLLGVGITYTGVGTPEAVITARIGSLYLRLDGTPATTIYAKESGLGNTGWVQLGRAARLGDGNVTFGLDATLINGSGISLADNAIAQPMGNVNNFSGVFWIIETGASGCIAQFMQGGGAVVKVAESLANVFTTTAATAARANVYISGNVIQLENKLGGVRVFNVFSIRIRTSL